MVKYYEIQKAGGPEVLTILEEQEPKCGPGEVLVRHEAIGINRGDILYRNGTYHIDNFPSRLGKVAVGEIEEIGEEVEGYQEGDRVVYSSGPLGAYSESRVIHHKYLFNTPADHESSFIAAYFDKLFTAHYLLRAIFIAMPGDYIVIRGAAGGVGHALSQLAAVYEVNTIGIVSNKDSMAFAKQTKCKYVFLESDPNLISKIKKLTGGIGVRAVFDFVGGKGSVNLFYEILCYFGLIAFVGEASGQLDTVDLLLTKKKGLFLNKPDIDIYKMNRKELILSANETFALMDKNVISESSIHEYSFDNIAQAHKDIEAREKRGCFVAVLENPYA